MSRVALKWAVFWISALGVFLAWIGIVAYAAENTGGKFWEILNKILASGNWQTDTTGTVKNAQNLGGIPAEKFVKIADGNQECGANMCVTGLDSNGKLLCK